MLAALQVEVVRDREWLLEATEVAGPFVIALAAITAALIAWRSAGTRLRHELAHDREMRRDEYRRDALDSALEVATETSRGIQGLLTQLVVADAMWMAAEEVLRDPGKTGTQRNEALAKKSRAKDNLEREFQGTDPKLDSFAAAITRLRVRFGIAHAIPKAADALLGIWKRQYAGSINPMIRERPRSEEESEEEEQRAAEASAAYADFMTTCEAWLRENEVPSDSANDG